ncbi:hypothetical protein ElyMa_000474000 [Elysia marginata]|uniref:G-protein coupled receptors family 1 profile domain-containing protein n=1 Tax=Elysia marginata TaxID=1093978 RepID=A0AAV4FTI5_9GAST|nr:hypothetical protein ElyMa_000474000 [Elysia marginata]
MIIIIHNDDDDNNDDYSDVVVYVVIMVLAVVLAVMMMVVAAMILRVMNLNRYLKLCSFQKHPHIQLTANQSRNASLVLMFGNLLLAAPCLYLFENTQRGVCRISPENLKTDLVKGYYW